MSDNTQLKCIIEAALFATGKPLQLDHMLQLFEDNDAPEKAKLREVLADLADDYQHRGIELKEVSSGFRIQIRSDYSRWVSRLWDEKPGRYSRALMETLALIAYRQPITRGEIEDIRGVSVSSHIMKTLLEREWVRSVGHRDVPGRPSLYATTRAFLDYFNLKSLDELPTLAEIRDLDTINRELELNDPDKANEYPVAGETADDETHDVESDEHSDEKNVVDSASEITVEDSNNEEDDAKVIE